MPGLSAPTEFRAIVNAHFRIAPPADFPPMIGVLNGTVEWMFAFPDRLSVTISGADRLLDQPREELAATDLARGRGTSPALPADLPPWQIVRERRATFAATPAENAKRPGAATTVRAIFTLRAIGPTRACPRPSKVPFAPATGQPIWRCAN